MTAFGCYIFVSFVASLVLGLVAMPLVESFCKSKNLYDVPDSRKVHHGVVPRLGGVCFVPCMVVSFMLAFAILGNTEFGVRFAVSLWTCYFAVGLLGIYAAGVVDDVAGLSPRTKFIVQIFAASILPLSGLYINNLYGFCGIYSIPFAVGVPLTVFVIVFVCNAVNLIDGIDGLASSLSVIAFVGFLYLFWRESMLTYCILISGFLGVLVSFMRYNLFGRVGLNKIFMGDSGSLTLGFILGTLFVKCSMVRTDAVPQVLGGMPVAYSFLLVPVFDVCRVILVRFLHYRSLFAPDKNHIHHKLLRAGFDQYRGLLIIVFFALVFIGINHLLSKCCGFTLVVFSDVLLWGVLQQMLNDRIKKNGNKVFL